MFSPPLLHLPARSGTSNLPFPADSNVRRPDRHWALDEKTVTVDGELRVLNEDGRPAAVLHQFDRFPALKTYAAAKWENANS